MILAEFDLEEWIERLAQLLLPLAQAQEAYLREYQERHARVIELKDGERPPFPLNDLQPLYAEVRFSRLCGQEAHYAPLRALLDRVRYVLPGHPTLGRVAVSGRLIGDNDFRIGIPGSGSSVTAAGLIAGLMARAAELAEDSFRAVLRELSAFLSPVGDGTAAEVLGNLDEACDVLLFHGLALSEKVEAANGMMLLPYGEVLRFVDKELAMSFAPRSAGFHGWRSVGAIVRPFRWRPEIRRRGRVNEQVASSPPFFREAATLPDLMAVSHATPVVPLAALWNRIDGSAGRLVGRETQSPGFYQSWPALGFSGFDECPAMSPAALAEAKVAFGNRESPRFARMMPILKRLSEALVRNGRFALADKVVDVAIALERMYVQDEANIGRKLRSRTSRLLGTDAASEERIREHVKELYDVRSEIVHNRLRCLTQERVHSAFENGFDLARRSLFKLLCEDPSASWKDLEGACD